MAMSQFFSLVFPNVSSFRVSPVLLSVFLCVPVSLCLWCGSPALALLAPGSLLMRNTCCPSAHQPGSISNQAQLPLVGSLFQPLQQLNLLSTILSVQLSCAVAASPS